jgi:hypothetical protein
LYLKGESIALFGALKFLFETPFFSSKALFEAQKAEKMDVNVKKMLNHFAMLDDFDIIASLKLWTSHTDFILSFLSSQILERKLFKLTLQNEPISAHQVERLSDLVLSKFASLSPEDTPFLLMSGAESNRAYATNAEIQVLFKDGKVVPLSSCVDIMLHSQIITKFYLCYPKNLS